MSQPHRPEASTPALDEFLRGERLRRLTGAELRARIHAVFAADRGDALLPEETAPQRIMVMWRIVRATALAKGICADEESLDEATELTPDPWVEPFRPIMTPVAQQALRRERAARLLRLHAEGAGLPLLPPREDAAALARWCLAASIIASDLGVERHREGLLGLQGLLDPHDAVMCDVTADQVIAFEEMMMEGALDLLLDVGERAAVKHYREQYGLTRKEVAGLLRLAKAQALSRTMAATEEKRALQEARLEDFIGRAKEAMNMDDEMKALKELAKVQGLTRGEPESDAAEFLEVVRRVAKKQDADSIPAHEVRLLDAHRAEEVQPVTLEASPADPDDEEAIAEYDRENQHR